MQISNGTEKQNKRNELNLWPCDCYHIMQSNDIILIFYSIY